MSLSEKDETHEYNPTHFGVTKVERINLSSYTLGVPLGLHDNLVTLTVPPLTSEESKHHQVKVEELAMILVFGTVM